MLRRIAISIVAVFACAGSAWADYTYDDVEAALRENLDPNRDGVVTQSEYSAYFHFMSWTSPPAMSEFDSNQNAVLEASEMTGLVDHIGSGISEECDGNMDYAFSGGELACLMGYVR